MTGAGGLGVGMDHASGERRFHFEDKTSDIARLIELPKDQLHPDPLRTALRRLLETLGAMARSVFR